MLNTLKKERKSDLHIFKFLSVMNLVGLGLFEIRKASKKANINESIEDEVLLARWKSHLWQPNCLRNSAGPQACSWYVIISPPLSVLLVASGSQLNTNSWEPTVDGFDELCTLNSL